MRGKAVPKGMATDTFVDFGTAHGGFQRFLDAAGVEVVPPDDGTVRIARSSAGWKNKLPNSLAFGVGILAGQGLG
jgi:hypothetical protein